VISSLSCPEAPAPFTGGGVISMSYRQLRSLRNRNRIPPASGPCQIASCRRPPSLPRIYDHCHAHDRIRGVVCNWCNGLMALIDRRISLTIGRPRIGTSIVTEAEEAALLAHWRNCPACVAAGNWRPLYRLTGNYVAKHAADRAVEALRKSEPHADDDTISRVYCEAGSAADPGANLVGFTWCYRLSGLA
jgi:hypothetical protein